MLKYLELKIPPLVVTLIFGLIMWGISNMFSFFNFIHSYLMAFSFIVFFVGGIIAVMAVMMFKNDNTTVDPTKPTKSTRLVTYGVYKYSRNPMYLSFLLWLIAVTLFLGNPINLFLIIVFVAYINLFQIKPEERALMLLFDQEFEIYINQTRRWL